MNRRALLRGLLLLPVAARFAPATVSVAVRAKYAGDSTSILLYKADLAVADLASGGLMTEAQAARFMQILISRASFIPEPVEVPMSAPKERRW